MPAERRRQPTGGRQVKAIDVIQQASTRYTDAYPLRAVIQLIPVAGGAIDTLLAGEGARTERTRHRSQKRICQGTAADGQHPRRSEDRRRSAGQLAPRCSGREAIPFGVKKFQFAKKRGLRSDLFAVSDHHDLHVRGIEVGAGGALDVAGT